MKIKKKLCFLIQLLLCIFTANGQHVDFYRENIVFNLDAAHIKVAGDLYFKNNSSRPADQTMFFPLPVRTTELKRDTFSIFDASNNSSIKSWRKHPAGIFYMLSFQPGEQKKIHIDYSDDHDGHSVRYLLMTHTKYWGDPLSLGNYTLKFDENSITIDSISYLPGSTLLEEGITVETWKKNNYMPDKELIIWFHLDKK